MKKLESAILFFFCLCQSLCVVLGIPSKSHPITTLINAKWTFTPLHLEVAEFIAEESPTLYWSYVDSLNRLTPEISNLGKNFIDFSFFHVSHYVFFCN